MGKLKQLAEVGRRDHALHDFRSDLAFRFRPLALGDVLDAAFVIKNTPVGIADDSRTLSNPDPGTVFTIDFVFEVGDEAFFLQRLFKLIARDRIGITLAFDIAPLAD